MRILHVVPTYLPARRYGGPIRSVHGLCRALAALGCEVHVATTPVDGPRDSEVPLGEPVDLDGVRVWYFPARLRRLYWSPGLAAHLGKVAADFDIIHAHSVFLHPTTAACAAARQAGTVHVISPRGMLVRDLIARRGSLRKRAWIRLFERRNLAGAQGMHCTTRAELEEIDRLGLSRGQGLVIPNGVDLPRAWKAAEVSEDIAPLLERGGYVLALGRISWKKGLDLLVDMLKLLPDEVHLVVAGNDDEDLAPALHRQAHGLGVSRRLHILDRMVEGADKEALFARAACLALPSLSENFGIVVLEAMIRGLPVLVSPEVGLAGKVEECGAGVVVARIPEAMARAAQDIISNEEHARRMGEQGRTRALRDFTWEAVARAMLEAYEHLHGKKSIGSIEKKQT